MWSGRLRIVCFGLVVDGIDFGFKALNKKFSH